MNLVISGPVTDNLRNAIVSLSTPRGVARLHKHAYRLQGAGDTPQTRNAVAAICDSARVDHAYVEEGLRLSDFRLMALDMDSTLITIECIDEIADFADKKSEVAAITEAAMRGEIADFAESLRQRVALLRGIDVSILRRVYDERLKLTAGAQDLLNAMAEHGAYTMLLSGGFTYFTERLKSSLALSAAYGNVLVTKDNQLVGSVREPILDAAAKATLLADALMRLDISSHKALAIGDGANDIPMMTKVEHSIAYHAKPATNARARYRILFGSLSVALDYFEKSTPNTGTSFAL